MNRRLLLAVSGVVLLVVSGAVASQWSKIEQAVWGEVASRPLTAGQQARLARCERVGWGLLSKVLVQDLDTPCSEQWLVDQVARQARGKRHARLLQRRWDGLEGSTRTLLRVGLGLLRAGQPPPASLGIIARVGLQDEWKSQLLPVVGGWADPWLRTEALKGAALEETEVVAHLRRGGAVDVALLEPFFGTLPCSDDTPRCRRTLLAALDDPELPTPEADDVAVPDLLAPLWDAVYADGERIREEAQRWDEVVQWIGQGDDRGARILEVVSSEHHGYTSTGDGDPLAAIRARRGSPGASALAALALGKAENIEVTVYGAEPGVVIDVAGVPRGVGPCGAQAGPPGDPLTPRQVIARAAAEWGSREPSPRLAGLAGGVVADVSGGPGARAGALVAAAVKRDRVVVERCP